MKKTKLTIAVVAGYLLCQIIADVTAVKIISFLGFTIPAATFIYALSFTMRDLAHKQLGKKATTYLIIIAGVVNILMAAYFIFTIYLKPAPFWGGQEAYAMTLGMVPRIVIASILAELVAELLDTEIYQRFWEKFPNAPQFTRVLASNGVAAPIDSILFISIAFAGTMPVQGLLSLIIGQAVFKFALAIISMPMIYLIPQNLEYTPEANHD